MTILAPQTGDIPAVVPTDLSKPFWDGCREGKLLYQYFPQSGHAEFPPMPFDRVSLSSEYEWRASSGRGHIYSFTTVWRGQSAAFDVPYVVAIVSMAENYFMMANVIGCEPDEVQINMSVWTTFHLVRPGFALPYFVLDK